MKSSLARAGVDAVLALLDQYDQPPEVVQRDVRTLVVEWQEVREDIVDGKFADIRAPLEGLVQLASSCLGLRIRKDLPLAEKLKKLRTELGFSAVEKAYCDIIREIGNAYTHRMNDSGEVEALDLGDLGLAVWAYHKLATTVLHKVIAQVAEVEEPTPLDFISEGEE